jgi:hypothetical protein
MLTVRVYVEVTLLMETVWNIQIIFVKALLAVLSVTLIIMNVKVKLGVYLNIAVIFCL